MTAPAAVSHKYFEDFQAGDVIDCGGRTVTKDEIIAFAKEYDPQPIHVDEAYAAQSYFGEVVGSGLHMLGICMRHAVDTFLREAVTLGSPGTESIKFPKPLRPGHKVRVKAKIVETTPSRSKPDRGRVKLALELYDEQDGLLAEWISLAIVGRRPQSNEVKHA
jgi:acyl dehydratase